MENLRDLAVSFCLIAKQLNSDAARWRRWMETVQTLDNETSNKEALNEGALH